VSVVVVLVVVVMYCVIISCEQNISKSYTRILMKFIREVGRDSRRNQLDFNGHRDSFVDLESFSGFFTISG